MSNYCTTCGQEVREGDKFSAECGTPIGSLAPLRSTHDGRPATSRIGRLSQRACSPERSYTSSPQRWVALAATSQRSLKSLLLARMMRRTSASRTRVIILTAVLTRLISDGWEQLPEKIQDPIFGYIRYGYRFRRLVRT